jgi:hypothetical protein
VGCVLTVRRTALFLLLCAALPLQAGLIVYSDRPTFDAAAPGLPIETFEAGNIGAGVIVACPSPLDSLSNNSCFSPGSILPGIQFASSGHPADGIALAGAGFAGLPSKAIFANYFEDTLGINLLSPATAIGFDLYSINPSTIAVSIYDPAAVLLGSYNVGAGSSPVFFGVISDSGPIGSVGLASLTGAAEGIDNVAFGNAGAIPEPATFGLLGAGLLALGLARLRQ